MCWDPRAPEETPLLPASHPRPHTTACSVSSPEGSRETRRRKPAVWSLYNLNAALAHQLPYLTSRLSRNHRNRQQECNLKIKKGILEKTDSAVGCSSVELEAVFKILNQVCSKVKLKSLEQPPRFSFIFKDVLVYSELCTIFLKTWKCPVFLPNRANVKGYQA